MNLFKQSATALLFGAAVSVFAAERLFDFSSSNCGWKSNAKNYSLECSGEYPVTGTRGLLFTGPKWDGREFTWIWPSFENRALPQKDWSKYDRLVVPVYNDSAAGMEFNIFVSDSKKPLRHLGTAFFGNTISPYTSKQFVLRVKETFAARGVNPKDISIIHCYTENPKSEVRFFVGDFTLLEPGEPVPELPKSYQQKILRRQAEILAPRLKQLETEAAAFDFSSLSPEDAELLRGHVASQLARFRGDKANDLLLFARNTTQPEWKSVQSLIPAMAGFAALRNAVAAAPGYEDVLLGYATPMEKVLPRAPIFRPLPKTIAIEAAQNEKEAAQLIVMPFGKERKKVGVKLTDFTGEAGTLPSSALSAVPVGFVETTFVPPSGSDYIGFWPDPLLTFLDTVDVKAGEAQPFWIKADVPAGQPAGVYSGKAEVTIEGKTAFSVPVSIRVRNFALPNHSMLPLAVTFWPNDDLIAQCNPNFDAEARKSPAAPVHAWKRHKQEWRDLLAGYYLMVDSLYLYYDWEPQLELLAELAPAEKLGMFNLGYCYPASNNPADNYGMQSTIDRIRPRYEKAKQLGILKYAYVFGADELPKGEFQRVNRAAAILKKEFPDLPLLTTSYDYSFGVDGQLGAIDWFCPGIDKYNAEQAAVARKAGKQVWWYFAATRSNLYPNNFIESTGIGIRLLMGAMSVKYRPDGFLYYQTSLWSNTAPITSGPYTDWNAQSFPAFNGDGNWTYPGPDGTPLGAVRLENFRDGLEDYTYTKILEQRLAAAKQAGQNPQWQQEAEAALAVPASLVESLTEYTRDPQKVYAWRSHLAELIERAPLK